MKFWKEIHLIDPYWFCESLILKKKFKYTHFQFFFSNVFAEELNNQKKIKKNRN